MNQENGSDEELTQLRRQNVELNRQAIQFETLNSECRASLDFFKNVEAKLNSVE